MFNVNYTDVPSKVIVRTDDQHVLMSTRVGPITSEYLDLIREVLDKVKSVSRRISKKEYLMLRGFWFDTKNGCFSLYIDLLHSHDIHPSLTEDEIKEAFHVNDCWPCKEDGYARAVSVDMAIIKEHFASDYFYLLDDKYYVRVKDGIYWH